MSRAGCEALPSIRLGGLHFDGITYGSAHLESGMAPPDANRTYQPSARKLVHVFEKGKILISQTLLR